MKRKQTISLLCLVALLFTGCEKEEVSCYDCEKEVTTYVKARPHELIPVAADTTCVVTSYKQCATEEEMYTIQTSTQKNIETDTYRQTTIFRFTKDTTNSCNCES